MEEILDNETPIEETPTETPVEETPTETPVEEVPEEDPNTPLSADDFEVKLREVKNNEQVDYGEDIDPEDAKTIGAIVDKQTAGFKQQLRKTQDRNEVEAFLQDKPQFSKYKQVILKALDNETWGKLPVSSVAYAIAGEDMMKLGAKAEREAQIKADSTKTGGTMARRPQGQAKDWTKASKADFEAHRRSVLGQR